MFVVRLGLEVEVEEEKRKRWRGVNGKGKSERTVLPNNLVSTGCETGNFLG